MRIVAVDTETVRGKAWSVQLRDEMFSTPDMFYCDNPRQMAVTKKLLADPTYLTVLHNAKYDLGVLAQCGIHPAQCECTMQMAYLLGMPALSLKVLFY